MKIKFCGDILRSKMFNYILINSQFRYVLATIEDLFAVS